MEQALGLSLAKEHSAADWSKRPIPEDWLNYAALDVERLTELREWQIERLTEADKLDWAMQEFAYLAAHANDPAVPRKEPWRRLTGLHTLRTLLGLAVARELWLAREELARSEDRAPGRVLPDRNIVEVARSIETNRERRLDRTWLRGISGFAKRSALRNEQQWLAAVNRAVQLPKAEYPARHLIPDGPPQPRAWERRWPESFERFNRVRPALIELAGKPGGPGGEPALPRPPASVAVGFTGHHGRARSRSATGRLRCPAVAARVGRPGDHSALVKPLLPLGGGDLLGGEPSQLLSSQAQFGEKLTAGALSDEL